MSPNLIWSACFQEPAVDGEQDIPSFRYGSPNWISAAVDYLPPAITIEDEECGSDFEFSFSSKVEDMNKPDKFLYPLFNRDLSEDIGLPVRRLPVEDMNNARSSTASLSSWADEMEGVRPETFCLWEPRSVPPSPSRWKKSNSTGSQSRRWRLRDLMFGRSHSDGKNKLGFVGVGDTGRVKSTPGREVVKAKVTELDIVTAHRLHYGKSGSGRQRSLLPGKQNIVGFFGQGHRSS